MGEHYLKKELYETLERDNRIFDFLQAGALDGIWYWDLEKPENEWMSPGFWEVLGFDPGEKKHLASEWQDLIFPEDLETAIDNFNKHCADQNHPYDQIVRYRHRDGSTVWVRCRGIAIRDKKGKPLRMLGAHNDITVLKKAERERDALLEELQEKNAQLKHAATHDFLTGLPNRVLLYDRFAQNASLCRRSGMKMGICIADTDDFKVINDTYGHQEGDRVLKEIGNRIQPSLREYDTTARLGGDEFALLLLNVREKKEIDKIMNRMLKNANQQIPMGKRFVQVSISVGTSVYPDDGDTLDELLGKADKAMYLAKDSGGNRHRFFEQKQ